MYVMDTRKIYQHFLELSKTRMLNQILGIAVSIPMMDEIVFDNVERIKELADRFPSIMESPKSCYSADEALIGAMLLALLQDSGALAYIPAAVVEAAVRQGKVFKENAFVDNPYLQNISFHNCNLGNFKLSHNHYKKYELLMYSTPFITEEGIQIPRIATFNHVFRYPCIMEGHKTWMSITPNEIFTLQEPIDAAHGRVLTFGCGMGYYAFMAARKDSVSSMTIVEKSPEVIDLFTRHILPQFPCRNKIQMIQADAFEYVSNLEDGNYDYCFADLWFGNNDLLPYLKIKALCGRFKQMEISYWIEDAMLETIKEYIWQSIVSEVNKSHQMAYPIAAKVLNNQSGTKIGRILKDIRITT